MAPLHVADALSTLRILRASRISHHSQQTFGNTPEASLLTTLTAVRAPGSVKVRAGGESPRPEVDASRQRWNRWNSGTDGESPDGRSALAVACRERSDPGSVPASIEDSG